MRLEKLVVPALVLAAGCATSTYPLNPQLAAQAGLPSDGGEATAVSFTEPVDGTATKFAQQGSCSWYGPGFHGRRTSNGEVFNKHAMTAAHKTLPFGSEVEVTNKANGAKVRVRINDRGPFIRGRILDLSYAAANSLDMVGRGVTDVSLRVIGMTDEIVEKENYALEVAKFTNRIEADKFVDAFKPEQRGAGLYYIKAPDDEASEYRVRFGPFVCEDTAKTAASRLKKVGLEASLLREEQNRIDIN